MGNICKIFYLLFVLFLNTQIILSQKYESKFKHINVEHGLSQNWVHAIVQDSLGFIWIASDNGLNRYDGTNMIRYLQNSTDSTTISNNTINALCLDSKKELWIGTSQGLNIYKQSTNSFYRKSNWPMVSVQSIAEDEHSNFWWGTYSGLYYYTSSTKTYTRYLPCIIRNDVFKIDSGCLSSGQISIVYIDSKKNVWIGTNNGLNLYVKKTNSFINYLPNKNEGDKSLYGNEIFAIFEDSDGRLWIGTNLGLNWFINSKDLPKKGVFMHFKHDKNNPSSFPSTRVSVIDEDSKKQLWVGTDNFGLSLLDLSKPFIKNEFIHIRKKNLNSGGLSSSSISSIFKDRSNNMWVGTFGRGINLYTSSNENFLLFEHEPINKNSINDDEVYAVLNDNDYLWVGNDGLNRINKKTGEYELFVHDESSSGTIGSNAVWEIYKDSESKLWIGTWAGGLNLFDYKTKSFKTYSNNPKDSTSIGSNNIFSILEDNNKNLWIGTMGGGLSLFNKKTNTFRNFNNQNSEIATNYIEDIVQTPDGYLWLANVVSLERFDIKTHKFKHYQNKADDSKSILGKKVFTLFLDSKSNLWIGTDQGLNLYQQKSDNFVVYTTRDGLPDNSIRSIIEDKQGNLWLGTSMGLSMFRQAVYLPEKPVFKNYTREDGLQGNEFNRRVSDCSDDGYVYMGGSNGLTWFNPLLINENKEIPNVVITDFLLFNQPVVIGAEDSLLKKHISITDTLILKYSQSVFTFRFVAINYIVPQKNQYAYKLDGFDSNWNYIGNKQEATYTNLSPGKYVLRFKACNNDGVWNETGKAIFIRILPPWWKTWWFRILTILFTITCFFGFYQWRFRNLKRQKRNIEIIVDQKTKEVSIQKEELQAINEELSSSNEELFNQREEMQTLNEELTSANDELNSRKEELENILQSLKDAQNQLIQSEKMASLGVLSAGVAHEINNPLNFIQGGILGLENYLSENLNEHLTELEPILNGMHVGVSRAAAIVTSLNHYSRRDENPSIECDIHSIIENCLVILQNQTKNRIDIAKDYCNQNERIIANEGKLHQAILNILANACQAIDDKGIIRITTNIKNESFIVSIEDSGCGISNENLTKIMDPFFTTKDPGKGTGLGLSITYNIIHEHNGTIEINSTKGKGTTVKICLPLKSSDI